MLYLRFVISEQAGKTPTGRPRCRWVDNMKINFRKIGLDGMDWTDLAQDRDQ
jgi:hypothetical protein